MKYALPSGSKILNVLLINKIKGQHMIPPTKLDVLPDKYDFPLCLSRRTLNDSISYPVKIFLSSRDHPLKVRTVYHPMVRR